MEVTLHNLEGLKREITVTIPPEDIESKVAKQFERMRSSVTMRGFRKGKVPLSMVKNLYNKQVRGEIIEKEISKTYAEAIQKKELNPAGLPSIQIVSDEAGKPFEYTAVFEVYPTIELNSLDGVELEEMEATVTDQDVQDTLEKLRKQQAEWLEVDRPAQNGDKVVIDYEGIMNGEPFEGGTGKHVRVELGSGVVIPDLETGLIGLKPKEDKDIPVKFPDNYPNKQFAGLPAVFKIHLHQVLEAKLPELNDEFAEKIGVKEGGLDTLKNTLRETMQQELNKAAKNILKQHLLDKFLELNPVDVPSVMVEEEINRLQQEASQEMGLKKQKDLSNFPRENFREVAEIRVTLGLLFAEFIKKNEMKVDQDRVRSFIEQLASSYQKPEQIIDWYYGHKQQLAQIESRVLEEQVVDKLFEQIKINKKPCSYQEVINYKPSEVNS